MASPPNDKNKKKNDKSTGLKSWLSTDDWLGVGADSVPMPRPSMDTATPMPLDLPPLPDLDAFGGTMASDGPGSMLPLGAEKGEQAQMRVSETPSSARIAQSDIAELTAALSVPDHDSDDSIDLATPPDGAAVGPPSLTKLMKASGAKSDILRSGDDGPKSGDAADIHAGNFNPTGPGSGWLGGSATRLPAPKPTKAIEEISDIFSGARHSDAGKDGTGSNLLPGMSGIGRSSVFNDPSRIGLGGGESDLFGGLTGATGDRGSSLYDDPAKRTHKVKPTPDANDIFRNPPAPFDDDGDPSGNVPLIDDEYFNDATVFDARPLNAQGLPQGYPQRTAGPESSGRLARELLEGLKSEASSGSGNSRPDYNKTDKSASGSNLFDDVTALDIDLASEPGASGVNWLDPNRTGAQDSGPGSSIFLKPNADNQSSDPGHVDFSHIPMMGSTDDPADMVQNKELMGPASSVMKKEVDKTMRELSGGPGSVSFDMPDDRIPWGAPGTLAEQTSMRMTVSDDELDLAAPSGSVAGLGRKKPKKDSDSVFDDSPEFPEGSAIGLGVGGYSGDVTERQSGSILQGASAERLRLPNAVSKTVKPGTPKTYSSQEFDLLMEPPAAKAKRGSGLLVTAASLLVGTGIGAAGMYFGLPSDASKPIVRAGSGETTVAKADLVEANRLLDTGDPVGALAAFKQSGEETAVARAGRGQARWMTKLREVAATGRKLDSKDLDVSAARADLTVVVEMGERLQTPVERQALMKAALNLGLIHEATNKPEDAKKLYTSMATKFAAIPNFKRVFESAAQRVTTMQMDGNNKKVADSQYSLSPETLQELGLANFIVLEFDAVQPSTVIEEAGFHFWDAVQAAAANDYRKAADSLTKAKTVHERQRKLLIGMGLNPLSDPTEQIFQRSCNELGFYYAFKAQLYDDPAVGAYAKKNATKATLDKLIAVYKTADTYATEIAAERKRADVATADGKKAKELATALSGSISKQNETLKLEQTANAELKSMIATAQTTASAATEKLKKAEAALDPVIEKLKAAKLIDDKATRDEALAALPELAKKPTFLNAGTGTNAEMAKELVTLRETAKKEKDEADKKIKDLTDLTKDTTAKMDAAVKAAERNATQAVADKLAAAELLAKRLKEQVTTTQTEMDAKLAAQAQNYENKIAAARAGATVTISDVERDAKDQAARAYGLGRDAFSSNRLGDAESYFNFAVGKNANDARYWYYLGLTKARQGQDARGEFDRGAKLEARGLPSVSTINADIVQVQGGLRQTLDALRP